MHTWCGSDAVTQRVLFFQDSGTGRHLNTHLNTASLFLRLRQTVSSVSSPVPVMLAQSASRHTIPSAHAPRTEEEVD